MSDEIGQRLEELCAEAGVELIDWQKNAIVRVFEAEARRGIGLVVGRQSLRSGARVDVVLIDEVQK